MLQFNIWTQHFWIWYCFNEIGIFQEFWEKKPLHMKRDDPEYYKTLFSTKALDKVIWNEIKLELMVFFLPDSSRAESGFWKELGCDFLLWGKAGDPQPWRQGNLSEYLQLDVTANRP